MAKRYYIAYGSNLNKRQMERRCPDARAVGTAELPGWRLMFKGSKSGNYLTIERADGYTVPVAVWAVSERDERNLDRYEGCPTFYYKKEVRLPVKLASGKTKKLTAFVYIMHEERSLGIPSLAYIRTCEEGYRNFGFDTKFLDAAYEISVKEVQR